METNCQIIGMQPDSSPSSEFFCEHEDGQMEHVSVQELLESGSLVQEKIRKKKKKYKGSPQSPKQILAFNTAKLLKLDEQKSEMKNKILSKCSSFPAICTLKTKMENSGESQDSNEFAMASSPHKKFAVLSRVASLPLKSALRGSFEELGIGPRPKLHVQWHPSVWEPPRSTISHTVIKKCPKKKASKHGSNGGADPCIKQNIHRVQNANLNSDSSMPMFIHGSKQLSPDKDKDVSTFMGNGVLENPELEALDGGLVSREVARHGMGEEEHKEIAAMNGQNAHDSICGSSLFVSVKHVVAVMWQKLLTRTIMDTCDLRETSLHTSANVTFPLPLVAVMWQKLPAHTIMDTRVSA